MATHSAHSRVAAPAVAAEALQRPPSFIARFFQTPLILYRLGLGWMLGRRFMQVTHVGRRSGKIYRSVLAVLTFNEETQEIRVVSPWNTSNWFHNIQATPALEVETGSIRYAPVQRWLTPEQIAEAFIVCRRQRPIFSRLVARIPGWNIDSTYDEFVVLARTLRGVAFRPKDE